ncbi:MAG: DUF3500 domain-containing protein [Planctomycetales bacterium]|nr:DUF3500 domain-containing protein [Planctomycetales bacterium]
MVAQGRPELDRRQFLARTTGAATALTIGGGWLGDAALHQALAETTALPSADANPESVVKKLFDSFSEQQRSAVCFDWNYVDPQRGLLRTRVANNWNITPQLINSDFYTDDQRDMLRAIFEGIIHPDWHERFDQQLTDDTGGWGHEQSIAIFGQPGDGKFEFVLTGRHMTLRCDGNSSEHVAFGGPIFYGHAVNDSESNDHPGNVFWPQAVAANGVFDMLDGKQRKLAIVERRPREQAVAFQGTSGNFVGIPVTELSGDQQAHLQTVLQKLLEPYRQSDRDEAVAALKAQGGLEKCHLAFYSDGDIGSDKVWDNWRLEGPSFVWYFRGEPHVHVWVNVADDPSVKLNA